MKDNEVDLNDLRLFVSVVEAGSITQAAELLGLPKSYISRHMTALETALGVSLMSRSRRGVVLNKTGERFFVHARAVLDLSHRAIDNVQEQTPKGMLKISVSYEMMHGLFARYIKGYCNRFPDVSLQILLDNRKVNMIYDGVDVAIRVGIPDVGDAVAKKITDVAFGLFASSHYLCHAPKLLEPDDLYRHQLIYKTDGVDWRFYQKSANLLYDSHIGSMGKKSSNLAYGIIEIKGVHKIVCNDFLLAKTFVHDGLGVAMLPMFLADETMVQVLTDWQIDSVPVYALYYKDRGRRALVASFVDYFLALFALPAIKTASSFDDD